MARYTRPPTFAFSEEPKYDNGDDDKGYGGCDCNASDGRGLE